jgi:hypothetical protein
MNLDGSQTDAQVEWIGPRSQYSPQQERVPTGCFNFLKSLIGPASQLCDQQFSVGGHFIDLGTEKYLTGERGHPERESNGCVNYKLETLLSFGCRCK